MYKVFGITVADIGLRGAADLVQAGLKLSGQQLVITANPEILVYAHNHPEYHEALKTGSLVVPDGVGLIFASHLSSNPIKLGRVTGVDLVQLLVKESVEQGYSVYLVGSSSDDILQKATHNLANKYGKINIIGINSGPKFSVDSPWPLESLENKKLLEDIALKKPDILLVGFGHPKQELWLNYYLAKVPVKVGIGVGGSFDYLAGKVARAPMFLRKVGLEWLWRLFLEPSRFKRIVVATLVFPALVLVVCFKDLFHVEQE